MADILSHQIVPSTLYWSIQIRSLWITLVADINTGPLRPLKFITNYGGAPLSRISATYQETNYLKAFTQQ